MKSVIFAFIYSCIVFCSAGAAQAHTQDDDSVIFIRCTVTSADKEEVAQKLLPPLILNFDAMPSEVQTLTTINGITFGFSVPHSVFLPVIALHITAGSQKSIVTRELQTKDNNFISYSTGNSAGVVTALHCGIGTLLSK